jgi:ethanolamine utilization protein EutQ (cupin superfamily)
MAGHTDPFEGGVMLDREVLVSSVPDDGWEPDPDVGGEMNTLYRTDTAEAGLSRFREPVDPIEWTLPARETFYVLEGSARIEIEGGTLEVGVGEMATIPKGATTTWYLTTPFTDFYVLS